jgi:hypothetical protein
MTSNIHTKTDTDFIKRTRDTMINVDGRYKVVIIWNERKLSLSDNKEIAVKRKLSLENRLSKDSQLKNEYTNLIEDQLKKNYIRVID